MDLPTAKHLPSELEDVLQSVANNGATCCYLKVGVEPTLRVAGCLQRTSLNPLNKDQLESIIAALLSEEQRNVLRSTGTITLGLRLPAALRFVVSVSKTISDYAVTLRFLPGQIPTIDELGLPPKVLADLVGRRKGLILVNGPARSGKSTTLAAMIDWINENCIFRSIVTPDSGPKWPPGPEQKSRVAKTANAYREDMR